MRYPDDFARVLQVGHRLGFVQRIPHPILERLVLLKLLLAEHLLHPVLQLLAPVPLVLLPQNRCTGCAWGVVHYSFERARHPLLLQLRKPQSPLLHDLLRPGRYVLLWGRLLLPRPKPVIDVRLQLRPVALNVLIVKARILREQQVVLDLAHRQRDALRLARGLLPLGRRRVVGDAQIPSLCQCLPRRVDLEARARHVKLHVAPL